MRRITIIALAFSFFACSTTQQTRLIDLICTPISFEAFVASYGCPELAQTDSEFTVEQIAEACDNFAKAAYHARKGGCALRPSARVCDPQFDTVEAIGRSLMQPNWGPAARQSHIEAIGILTDTMRENGCALTAELWVPAG